MDRPLSGGESALLQERRNAFSLPGKHPDDSFDAARRRRDSGSSLRAGAPGAEEVEFRPPSTSAKSLWLMEDPHYVSRKLEDFRRARADLKRQLHDDSDRLFENRTMYGSYSNTLRDMNRRRRELQERDAHETLRGEAGLTQEGGFRGLGGSKSTGSLVGRILEPDERQKQQMRRSKAAKFANERGRRVRANAREALVSPTPHKNMNKEVRDLAMHLWRSSNALKETALGIEKKPEENDVGSQLKSIFGRKTVLAPDQQRAPSAGAA